MFLRYFPWINENGKNKTDIEKGDRYDISNYDQYPFYVFSTILEKLIYNRLILFINKHNILTYAQNGFRENG